MTLTVNDFDNAARDLKTVSAVANSRDPDTSTEISSYPTREGDNVDTLQGKLDKLGVIYDDPIRDWSPSLLVSDLRAHRYPATTGDVYIPIAPLPFTTGATFDSNNWILTRDFSDSQAELKIKEVVPTLTDLVFDTVASMQSSDVVLAVGYTINIKERGQRSVFECVTGETPDTYGILATNTAGIQAKVLVSGEANVEWFGAVVSQVAENKPAVEYASSYLSNNGGGVLHYDAGFYHSASGFLLNHPNIKHVGKGKPRVNDAGTALESGTILRGTTIIDADNASARNMGFDYGITYSDTYRAGSGGNAFVQHREGLSGINKNNHASHIVGLCRVGDFSDPEAAYHAILIEGINQGSAFDVEGYGGWFGVVFKCSNYNALSITGRENDNSSVYIKSNTYAPVKNFSITCVNVDNQSARGFAGFLIQSSDAELSNVTASNITVSEGQGIGVKIEAENESAPCVSVTVDDISTRNGIAGVQVKGNCFAVAIGETSVITPSGTGVGTAPDALGIHPKDVTFGSLRVAPSATTINSFNIASSLTKVSFDYVNALSLANTIDAGSVINIRENTSVGGYDGVLKGAGIGYALINGWAPFVGGQETGIIVRNGILTGYGRISPSAATSDIFTTLPVGFRPNNLEFYASAMGFGGGVAIAVALRVFTNGDMQIYPDIAAYPTLAWLDLTSIHFPAELFGVEGTI